MTSLRVVASRENRLLEIAANPNDGQIPVLVFDTPLAACRV